MAEPTRNRRSGPGRRRALVIATSSYSERSLDDLPTAKNDLIELTAVLGSPQIGSFEVVPLLDVTKETAQRHIERIFKVEAQADDFLIFYISGHGVLDDGQSLLVRIDRLPKKFASGFCGGGALDTGHP